MHSPEWIRSKTILRSRIEEIAREIMDSWANVPSNIEAHCIANG